MKPRTSVSSSAALRGSKDFSLFVGGPLFQLLRRAHLTDDTLGMVLRRVIVISLLCWLPLLAISALEGHLLSTDSVVPFLKDISIHVRLLVALPLLIVAEPVVHQRLHFMVTQFLEHDLIPEQALPRFDAAIDAAFRLRNSVTAELVLFVFVYFVGIFVIWREYATLGTVTWYAAASEAGPKLSFAGMWLTYVSLPVFQFILMRWFFKLAIWTRFLWHVSRIKLSLMPTHPDRVGGLGFLSYTAYAFGPLLIAHGAILAGHSADHIFFAGASLLDFMQEIVALVVFLMGVMLGPLLLFAPQIAQSQTDGLREYGALATRYVRGFDAKWLHGSSPTDGPLLGSPDIQSLASLSNSFDIVTSMHIAPISKQTIIQLVGLTVLPIAPLVLTLIPLDELLKKLFGILL
jgi:hypothetical protein